MKQTRCIDSELNLLLMQEKMKVFMLGLQLIMFLEA